MINFGSIIPGLGPISQFFANVLKFFDSFTGNFAVSVILLTVAFRIIVLPLSIKQTKSMIAMQRLQPKMKEIQKKYKDDREKQGQEMMKLYKENKVNPLGGCLPLLLQLPILFALFDVLRDPSKYINWSTSYSFLGIDNVMATGSAMWSGGTVQVFKNGEWLKTPQPYPGGEYLAVILLILLTIVTGFISSKMMMTDPKQSKMMALMPVMFGVFAWILPAGVTIYIIVTNVLTIAQQYVQLSREGFYEERRKQREKAGEPTSPVERLKDKTNGILVKLKIKEPPPSGKKAAGKAPPGKKSGGKQGAAGPGKPAGKSTAAPKGPPGGSQSGGKTPGQASGKKTAVARAEKAKADAPEKNREDADGSAAAADGSGRAAKETARKGETRQYPAKKKKGK